MAKANAKSESDSSGLQRALTIIVSIAVIGGAGYFISRYLFQKVEIIPNAYFYDLNTKKIFISPASQLAPIATPSGPFENGNAGVRLFLFSCAPCPNLNGKTLEEAAALGATSGWLERYTDETKQKMDTGDRNAEALLEGLQMRGLAGGRWISPGSKEALQQREAISRLCLGLPGKVCNPE